MGLFHYCCCQFFEDTKSLQISYHYFEYVRHHNKIIELLTIHLSNQHKVIKPIGLLNHLQSQGEGEGEYNEMTRTLARVPVLPKCSLLRLVVYLITICLFCFVLSCFFTFWVPCFDVRYDFRIKTMFGSCLPPVVCRRTHVLFTLFAHRGVQHILCCVFILFFLSIFDCPFCIL
jgi:hypothetical protein